jgi:KDO2-lipid IV(A) lauroyltransferase
VRPRSGLRNHAELAAYRLARGVARHLGPSGVAGLGGAIGAAYHRVGRRRREILDFNLNLVFPAWSEERRRSFALAVARHFGRVLLDALRLQNATPDSLRRQLAVVGVEHLEAALAHGRGVLCLSAHIGSWEVAALETGLRLPGGFAVINRPLDNPFLEAELERFRTRFGNRALGRDSILRAVLRTLGEGRAVGILIDQRARASEGITVPFLGHPASTHPILARLARRTRAPVVPTWAVWEGPGRYTVKYGPAVLVEGLDEADLTDEALTARFNRVTESMILDRPEQWLWYHDRWRELRTAGQSPDGGR